MMHVRVQFDISCQEKVPARTVRRLLRVRTNLLALAGPGASDGLTIDRHHMADVAAVLEGLEAILRRARAIEPPEKGGGR